MALFLLLVVSDEKISLFLKAMKFLLIIWGIVSSLWTKGSAIDREESLTDYTVEEGIVNESVLVEVPSSDLKNQLHSVFSVSEGF